MTMLTFGIPNGVGEQQTSTAEAPLLSDEDRSEATPLERADLKFEPTRSASWTERLMTAFVRPRPDMKELKEKSTTSTTGFRVMDRDAPFGQSYGRWNIARASDGKKYFFRDPFHTLIEVRTGWLLVGFWAVYIITFMAYALVFWMYRETCALGFETYPQALCLTVETMLTIGYGVPDPYFRACPWMSAFLMCQCLTAVVYDVTFVGLMYTRISRGTKRASTVVFSDKAVLQNVGAETYLMFRICEMRRTQLLDAKIRCYCIAHKKCQPEESPSVVASVTSPAQSPEKLLTLEPMRIERPDDSLGGNLLLTLPATVVHRIDKFSPLLGPPVEQEHAMGLASLRGMEERLQYGPLQRASDAEAGNRDGCYCDVCGSTFSSKMQLHRHLEFTAATEEEEVRNGSTAGAPHRVALQRSPLTDDPEELHRQQELQAEEIQLRMLNYWETHDVEVICIVEGTNAATSASTQARHSYNGHDMVWDHCFGNCVTTMDSGHVCIDFDHFNDLIPA